MKIRYDSGREAENVRSSKLAYSVLYAKRGSSEKSFCNVLWRFLERNEN